MKKVFLIFLLPLVYSCSNNNNQNQSLLDSLKDVNDSLNRELQEKKEFDSIKEQIKTNVDFTGYYTMYSDQVQFTINLQKFPRFYTAVLEASGRQTYYKMLCKCEQKDYNLVKCYFDSLIDGGLLRDISVGTEFFTIKKTGNKYIPTIKYLDLNPNYGDTELTKESDNPVLDSIP